MSIIRDIDYGGQNPHERRRGDFFASEAVNTPVVLLIHGGGWDAMSKESVESVALHFQSQGFAVFSINYRLLHQAPWPACLEDCLLAARFVLGGVLGSKPERIFVAGLSAGGHLAMMCGRDLGRSKVESVISMAGPSCVDNRHGTSSPSLFQEAFLRKFFGRSDVTPGLIASACPLDHIKSPPNLICLHSGNDQFVPLAHSKAAVESWDAAGAKCQLKVFDGPGNLHGFWDSDDVMTRKPSREFSAALDDIFRHVYESLNPQR